MSRIKSFGGLWFQTLSVLAILALANCNGLNGGNATTVTTDEKAPIVVWVDEIYQAKIEQYGQQHPDKKVSVKSANIWNFPTELLYLNNQNEGWPDLVLADIRIIHRALDAAHNFPLALETWVNKDIQDQFFPAALDSCRSADKKSLYCLPQQANPAVLWYNKALLEQWGYNIPTTWVEFQDLSDKVAKEHAGAVMGSAIEALPILFWASGCPIAHPLSLSEVVINTSDEKCVRAAKLIDHMVNNKTLSRFALTSEEFGKSAKTQLLMLPASAWAGQFMFGSHEDSLFKEFPEKQLLAAYLPKWDEQDQHYTSNQGMMAWMVSRHSKNPALAVDVARFAIANTELTNLMGPVPAHKDAAATWGASLTNTAFGDNPYIVFKTALDWVEPTYTDSVRYDLATGFDVLEDAIRQNGSVEASLPQLQEVLTSLAVSTGYQVAEVEP